MLFLVLIWPPTPFSQVTPEEEELFVPHSESVATKGSQPMEGSRGHREFLKVGCKISPWWLNYVLLCLEVVLVRRVLIFPKGNHVDHLSMYLDVAVSTTFQFSLAMVNQICSNFTMYLASF
ncbi:putative ubiquitinyl hydrolase 1 [Helianthus debilis subsp. tardiflorus]